MTRVVVIGGGSTGLAAAVELLDAGTDVVVLEASPEVASGALGERLGARVRCGTAVSKVEHSAAGVLVSGRWGIEFADAAVIAVPLALLGSLDITPPLPFTVFEAVGRTLHGTADEQTRAADAELLAAPIGRLRLARRS